jgi:hypothetical protein
MVENTHIHAYVCALVIVIKLYYIIWLKNVLIIAQSDSMYYYA